MKRREIDREVILLLLTTLIMVLTWVGFEVYRAYTKNRGVGNIERLLTPLDPKVDKVFLDKLNLRYQ